MLDHPGALLGGYQGPKRARLSSEQPYFGGKVSGIPQGTPEMSQNSMKHFNWVRTTDMILFDTFSYPVGILWGVQRGLHSASTDPFKALCKGRNGPYTLFFCFYDIWTFPGVSKTLIGHIWPLEVPKGCLCMFWNQKNKFGDGSFNVCLFCMEPPIYTVKICKCG